MATIYNSEGEPISEISPIENECLICGSDCEMVRNRKGEWELRCDDCDERIFLSGE